MQNKYYPYCKYYPYVKHSNSVGHLTRLPPQNESKIYISHLKTNSSDLQHESFNIPEHTYKQ